MQDLIRHIVAILVLLIWFWPFTLAACLTIWALVSTTKVLLTPIWTVLVWLFKLPP